jgi:hypothetical protein
MDQVAPGPALSRTSEAIGTGLDLTVAGDIAQFTITAKDAHGNILDTGGDVFDVLITKKDSAAVYRADVEYKGFGLYDVRCVCVCVLWVGLGLGPCAT